MKKLLLTSAVLLLSSSLLAEDTSEVTFITTEARDGIYVLSGVNGFTGGNIALSIGDDGVVMIDDAIPAMLEKLQLEVKKATNRDIDYLINTHIHGDHIGNNHAFGEHGARIISHDSLRDMLINEGVFNGEKFVPATKQSLPVISYSESMTLYLNNDELELIHLPAAHTATDTVVIFKNANVIHAGDIFFNGAYPFIDMDNGGSVTGYIAAQSAIVRLADESTVIIPGHGELANKQDLINAAKLLKTANQEISNLLEEGKSAKEILELDPLAEHHQLWGQGFIDGERMTKQLIDGHNKN